MTSEQAFSRAAALCARSEQCSSHILEKLLQWEAPDPDAVLLRLQEERYVDDARYARAFALDKLRYNQWGRVKTRAALRVKGIDAGSIAQAFEAIDQEEYLAVLDCVIARKRRELERREQEPYVLKMKLARHAASHGFEPSLVLDRLEN